MLDTVLQIGRTLRRGSPEKSLEHHRFGERCPKDEEDTRVLRLRIPVAEDVEIGFDEIAPLEDEKEEERLRYYRFKASDNSSYNRYVFGDIYFGQSQGTDNAGYYRLPDFDTSRKERSVYEHGSFDRGADKAEECLAVQEELLLQSLRRGPTPVSSLRGSCEQTPLEKRVGSIGRFHEQLLEEANRETEPDLFDSATPLRNIDLIERLLRYQAGIAQLIWEEGEKVNKELLLNEDRLRKLTAHRAFNQVAAVNQSAKRNFRKLVGEEEPEWESVKEDETAIDALVGHASGKVFLHFDFDGRHWYEDERALQAINQKLISEFVETATPTNGAEGFALKKYLYRTINAVGKDDGDPQLPDFDKKNRYQTRFFQQEELDALFYAIDVTEQAKIFIPETSIRIVALPSGEKLDAADITGFMSRSESLRKEQEREGRIAQRTQSDKLFAPITETKIADSIQFDLVFYKEGENVNEDLLEIAGVEKSFLRQTKRRVDKVWLKLSQQWDAEFGGELNDLNIPYAFRNLLGDVDKGQEKHQSHLCNVLPQIYTQTYYRDPVLLPALIEKAESSVRNGKADTYYWKHKSEDRKDFNSLKYDFYFLARIQNQQPGEVPLMQKITDSHSYKIGRPLGKMARELKYEINSFPKQYVGSLRRRIATLDDLLDFKADIEEKLIMHEKVKFEKVTEASRRLAENVKVFQEDGEERFDKNRCAFGFFESYFVPLPKEDDNGEPDEEPE
jgi:hypothetical protein